MLPHRRKTKEEIRHEEKVTMANKIMNCLARHQPKKKRKKEMSQFEPKSVVVSQRETKYTPTEIGEFLYHHTGRQPARLEGLVITWHLGELNSRQINFKCGTTLDLTLPAEIHYKEDPAVVENWLCDDIESLAFYDVCRLIAFYLTEVYKLKIQSLWER
jgi:hypothetical protein